MEKLSFPTWQCTYTGPSEGEIPGLSGIKMRSEKFISHKNSIKLGLTSTDHASDWKVFLLHFSLRYIGNS